MILTRVFLEHSRRYNDVWIVITFPSARIPVFSVNDLYKMDVLGVKKSRKLLTFFLQPRAFYSANNWADSFPCKLHEQKILI
jgi:hypothetical protein